MQKHSGDVALLNQLQRLTSEGRNSDTMALDTLGTSELLQALNREDQKVAAVVEALVPILAKAVDAIVDRLKLGGRLIYFGAGTSGRLGVLDAVECPPTFSVSAEVVKGIIAGGDGAMFKAVEGAEDSFAMGEQDVTGCGVCSRDVVVGIAASGRTPYVLGAIDSGNACGALTLGVSCNPETPVLESADIGICAEVGPEALTGSTRMKSGTAQKMILNMLSTASMVKLGKAYENLMVDVSATNQKLKARAKGIVMMATECSEEEAITALEAANNQAKLAILMVMTGLNVEAASVLLETHKGYLRDAITAA